MKNSYFKYSLFTCILWILFSFKNDTKEIASYHNVLTKDSAVEVTMENEHFTIEQNNLEPTLKTIFTNDSIQLSFWEDGNPIKLNFNLFNTNILEKGSVAYIIPEVNADQQMVDLNFYNKDRDVKRTNKRIIFRKGTINIAKLTNHALQMTFEGEGSGILEYGKNFPISGKVNVTY